MTNITQYTGSKKYIFLERGRKEAKERKKIQEIHHSTFGKQEKYLGITNLGLYHNNLKYFVHYRDSSTVMRA